MGELAETTPLLRVQLLTGARGFESLSVRHYKCDLLNITKFNSNGKDDLMPNTQINKIIQEMYAYDKDTDNFSGFSFRDMQNQTNLQIYG